MERLLITGVDTVLGNNLALSLADRCEVLGLHQRGTLVSPAVRTAAWNPDDRASLAAHFDQWQPQWVIHCGALCGGSWDREPDAPQARREPLVAARLVELASAWGSSLVVMSSDAVFAGPRLFHSERWPATNPSQRAALVRQLERTVECVDALIVRTHAFGWSVAPDAACFAERACQALLQGHPAPSGGWRHATPILASDLAEILWRAHETRLRGLYHISGAERTSAGRFVAELAASLGVRVPAASECAPAPHRQWHEETSLSSKRARRMLAVATPMLREGIDRFVEQMQNGWRDRWHSVDETRRVHDIAA